jgi:phosphatidate phosphatase APP1
MIYRGFCSKTKTWIKGRVLEDRLIVARKEDSAWRNLVNTYKRFSSREIWGAEVAIDLGEKTYPLQTDREGYFELETDTPKDFIESPHTWLHPDVTLVRTPWTSIEQTIAGELLFPCQPQFGIISDIDDTIIRTGVTSRLMWRAIYRTLLKNAGSRVIFKEASAFFRALSAQPETAQAFNPVFYVSNSPWNLYDLINDFLELNHLPKGPILLRDLGLPTEPHVDGYKGHKYENIARILQIYPELNFVLIGDSGEKDTDIYLEITQHFPGRVKAIYIRDVQHHGRTQRVRDLILHSGRAEVKLLSHFGEAVDHAEELGLLSRDVYERLVKYP